MQGERAPSWRVRTVTVRADAHAALCRDAALLAALREIVPPSMIAAAEARVEAPRCHYGTVGCTDTSDEPHECGKPRDDAWTVFREALKVNPALSKREALIRRGADICPWCGYALTPSGRHLHEPCGPQVVVR